MVILGALVNGIEACIGGVLGVVLRRWIKKDMGDFLLVGQGLCVAFIGIQGMTGTASAIIVTLSMALGALVGFVCDIDGWFHRLGDAVQTRLEARFGNGGRLGNFSAGFVPASLLVCTGSMAIVGSLQSGMLLDHATLFSKGAIDFIICMVMASTLGIGVAFSGATVFVYEGLLTLLATIIAPWLSATVIENMVATGSLLLFALGLNLMGVTRVKAANLIPACFMPAALVPLFTFLGLL